MMVVVRRLHQANDDNICNSKENICTRVIVYLPPKSLSNWKVRQGLKVVERVCYT